ncbi:MAG: hypothetical protein QF551_03350 [Candidatus Marinimicrobia bacterium]|jgi:hypothetical protein|nr:hypothetical protein [Candidatus Neomarinimicrobiota bacterium]MDP6456016.1 hypothetical protein [Candidatus Neomarinimicrobiota bacterium]MDP6836960.1 hypothetical protein [Candidatus Neomarinimicrobiota bacterium]MDP6966291.1 hypothetical protein [Candidatus Neomarinimicrobiota bacterium]
MEALNEFTLLHLTLCFVLGRFTKIGIVPFFVLTVGWEFVELILPFQFALESFPNKIFDIAANTAGYFLGRYSANIFSCCRMSL